MDTPVASTLMTIIKLVLAVMAVILLFNWITDLFGLRAEAAVLNNVKELKNNIDGLLANPQDLAFVEDDYFIDSNHILVGFSSKDLIVTDICGKETVSKPLRPECSRASCICLYKETAADKDFNAGEQPIACHPINADKIFTLNYFEDAQRIFTKEEKIWKNVGGEKINLLQNPYSVNLTNDYASFFIYGQCEDHNSDVNFGIQKLYIEKTVKDGSTFIFIAPSRSNTIEERKASILKEK